MGSVRRRKRSRDAPEEDETRGRTRGSDEEVTSDSEEEDYLANDDEEEKEREKETPEQKRLRLAKAYLKSMEIQSEAELAQKEEGDGDDDDNEGEREDSDDGVRGNQQKRKVDLSERLKVDALTQRGHYQRQLAEHLRLSPATKGEICCAESTPSTIRTKPKSARGCVRLVCRPLKTGGGGGFHRKSLTGVSIPSGDDSKCYTVSKCGALVGWDINELKRNNEFTKSVRGESSDLSKEALYSVCSSDDGRLVVTGGHSGLIRVWDVRAGGQCVKQFDRGHRSEVTGLAFQKGTMQLFSCSSDRTVKIWSLDDMAYVDTLFGHVQGCVQLDCLRKERVISVAEDRTCRLWKVQDETQLLFKGSPTGGNIDACCFVNGTTFMTGSQDNSVSLWTMFKKRPTYTLHNAHPVEQDLASVNPCRTWIHSIAACANTDLVASGSGNGFINLYRVNPDQQDASDRIRPMCTIPRVEGYVNGLAFNSDATVLVAAVGQEPRLGKWDRNKSAKNALFCQRLQFED